MPQTNASIIRSYLLNSTNDFQQRIPDPSVASMARVANAMFDPMNKDIYEDFTGKLLRVIGDQIVHSGRWRNPLREFKQASMRYGRTIEEIVTRWLPAHAYKVEPSEILKVYRPDSLVAYHSEDSRLVYKLTIQRDLLESAFYDEYGITNYITSVFDAAFNSAEYDEYNIMKQRIADHAAAPDLGFYQVHYSAVPANEAGAKAFLQDLRAFAGKLQFPSALYNAQGVDGVPVYAQPNDLVLMITPEVNSVIDVQALAAMFNIGRADIPYRIVQVDSFPVPGAFALLCSRDFLIARDTLYQVREWEDPDTLNLQWRLHKWGIFSTSPFAPAILFTTAEGTSPVELTMTVTDFVIGSGDPTSPLSVVPGGTVDLNPTLVGTLSTSPSGESTEGYSVRPNSGVNWRIGYYQVTPGEGGADPTYLGQTPLEYDPNKTYVDDAGILHAGDDLSLSSESAGFMLIVVAESTYLDPNGDTSTPITSDETPIIIGE